MTWFATRKLPVCLCRRSEDLLNIYWFIVAGASSLRNSFVVNLLKGVMKVTLFSWIIALENIRNNDYEPFLKSTPKFDSTHNGVQKVSGSACFQSFTKHVNITCSHSHWVDLETNVLHSGVLLPRLNVLDSGYKWNGKVYPTLTHISWKATGYQIGDA